MNGIRNPDKRPRDKKKASDRKKEVNAEIRFEKAYTAFIYNMQQMDELKDYYVPDVDDYENLTRGFEVVVRLTEKMVEKAKAAKKACWMKPEDEYEA
jgi:hypothetical protein